jgi:sulfatase maturation enzyme AslB (radical SAM superfamily)
MANQIRYQVGFDVNAQNLNQLKSSLQEIQKLKISDVMKFNDIDRAQATKALIDIKDKAKIVEDALREAFNQKLGTVNIETFNKTLKETKVSISDVYNTFSKAGVAG